MLWPSLILSLLLTSPNVQPIALHPENPHYFLWRGRPTVLITSGEHYGALINLDFDYRAYLAALSADRLNLTRVWAGSYVETGGSFNIANNTLDPAPGRFICPWARSETPGYADGGNKFDLTRWDAAYFARLRDLVAEAGRRGVVVELNLFCPMYEESMWGVSPLNARNNVNGLGDIKRQEVLTLDRSGGLLAVQEAMVRKIVGELKDFDNVYYEICNEPYAAGVPMDWQRRIADVIMEAQRDFPHKYLVSQNVANGSQKIADPHPSVSIFNFHYAAPPEAVAENYQLNKVIGDNETGFRGTADAAYRMEGWDFVVAGGGLFNNLDYSFTAAHPRGTWTAYPATQPGGGSPGFRRQMRVLRDFINGFNFIRMRPTPEVVAGGVPAGYTARALAEPGRAYAVYLRPAPIGNEFSARWTGTVEPAYSEEYTFHTFSNDGVRLWVDGRLVIDNWTDHAEKEDTGRIALEAGRKYPVKLEYFYAGGVAAMRLWWSSPSQAKEAVAADGLALPDGSGPGLKGEYFAGRNFDQLKLTRTDLGVDFDWGVHSPFPAAPRPIRAVLSLNLPPGSYRAHWVHPRSGAIIRIENFRHAGGARNLAAPGFREDIALRVIARR